MRLQSQGHCRSIMTGPRKSRGQRIVPRHVPAERPRFAWGDLRPDRLWGTVKSYIGAAGHSRREPIRDRAALQRFIDTRASHVSQTSLYGYLRTRAGMRYPELFEDDPFVAGINIAKWQMWLACVSDLAVFAGSRLAQHAPRETGRVRFMMQGVVDDILAAAGNPAEAGDQFATEAERVRQRMARVDLLAVGEFEAAFSESPTALVRWAPIMDELKELDEEIVRNSVRFRWQEVRRDLLRDLDPQAVVGSLPDDAA
jgi:hypothetical protein